MIVVLNSSNIDSQFNGKRKIPLIIISFDYVYGGKLLLYYKLYVLQKDHSKRLREFNS